MRFWRDLPGSFEVCLFCASNTASLAILSYHFITSGAEVFGFINAGKMLAGLGLIGLHVGLTLMATAIGFYIFKSVL